MIGWGWLILAFVVGEFAGWFLAALCVVAGRDERQKGQ